MFKVLGLLAGCASAGPQNLVKPAQLCTIPKNPQNSTQKDKKQLTNN